MQNITGMDIEQVEYPEDIYTEPVCPFEDEFRTKWWNRYQQLQNKDHIHRLYSIDKITKEDYITIVGEEPQPKKEANGPVVLLSKKTKSLEDENATLILDNMLKGSRLEMLEDENSTLILDNMLKGYKIEMLEDETSFITLTLLQNGIL